MISLIAAVAQNGVIGDKNALLWHLSEDLRHFKAITTGHPVIMGRRTYESLGRPLPDRLNVVVSRSADEIPGCRVVDSLDGAFELFEPDREVFVIGGAEIYAQTIDRAQRLYLTVIHRDYRGDARFPEVDPEAWRLVESRSFPCGKEFPHPYSFELYLRNK